MKEKTFTFYNLFTIQVGLWFVFWAVITAFSFGFFKLYLEDYLKILKFPMGLLATLVVFYFGIWIFKKVFLKKSISIAFNENNLIIEADGKEVLNIPVSDFKSIRTLDPENKKRASVQMEIFHKNGKKSFFQQVASNEQATLHSLFNFLQKEYNFTKEEVPFSIWTHNWQGIKYVEFKNPLYNEQLLT